ncbi:MAG: NifB/NifX family molybdenum-iron cluster-binding protein [Candidatus Thorarchaeota archaeon]|jgi:predicted Fe-Mo cluster-binding NifX family protein
MSSIRIAIPAESELGLDSPLSKHFGHCPAFVVSTIEDGTVIEVENLKNQAHTSCADPVMLLANNGVKVLITSGMGRRPYMISQQLGISVVEGKGKTVGEVLKNFLNGLDNEIEEDALCRGGSNSH